VLRAGALGALNAGQAWILGCRWIDGIDNQSYVSSVLKTAIFFSKVVRMHVMVELGRGITQFSDVTYKPICIR